MFNTLRPLPNLSSFFSFAKAQTSSNHAQNELFYGGILVCIRGKNHFSTAVLPEWLVEEDNKKKKKMTVWTFCIGSNAFRRKDLRIQIC